MSLGNVCEQLSPPWLGWIVASSWQLALLACIAAVGARLLRQAPARLRYGLWLLVLVKVFLPPGLTSPWSVGRWGIGPLVATTGISATNLESSLSAAPAGAALAPNAPEAAPNAPTNSARSAAGANQGVSARTLLMFAWGGGVLLFWGVVVWRYSRVARLIRAAEALDEGPTQVMLAQIAADLRLQRAPELFSTREATSPFLFGVIRPKIVLPATLLERLNSIELRAVLTHELVHFQRHDTWVGWLQVVANSLFWFHPCVWWANRQLRHERECVCDEAVLRLGQVTPEQYGESIFQTIAASRGRSLAAGSLVGVFERGAKLQNRLEDVMNFKPASYRSTWASRGALLAFALLFLPMAMDSGRHGAAEADEPKVADPAAKSQSPAAIKQTVNQTFDAKTDLPQIMKTSPQSGATHVNPATAEISITFDRDMGRGMSWTGGAPLFPPTDDAKKARWIDARTCVLPVKLDRGTYYRVGINSSSYQNFRGADGAAVLPAVICFVTEGASAEVAARVLAPKIVKLSPENGAQDVDPETTMLSVTFDTAMGEGMSWTGSGPSYPESPAGAKPTWSKDRKTCTLPVKLTPGHAYQLGLNNLAHNNFQSEWGAPLAPVVYKFRTRAAKE